MKVSAPASGVYDLSTGSSAAAAMTTGAALAVLSMHSDYTPAELEASLKSLSYAGPVDLVQLPPMDSDGDGAHDALESFAGSDPLNAADSPAKPAVSGASAGPDTSVTISFMINAAEFVSQTPYVLANGITWKVKESTDMKNWNDSTTGTLSVGTASAGKLPATYTRVGGETCCFLKLEITPAQ